MNHCMADVEPVVLELAMACHKNCTIIEGSMCDFEERMVSMGIEDAGTDGLRFLGVNPRFPCFFKCSEFLVDEAKYLRFGACSGRDNFHCDVLEKDMQNVARRTRV